MKLSYRLLLFFAFALFLIHLEYLYADIMEARNFVSAREMVQDGHWIHTTLNGESRYQKPPLPTWFSAFMAEMFGVQNLWALRFPAALSCSALILVFYEFLKKETQNKQLALTAGLILSTSFLVIFIGKRATWDIFCYSFAFIGIYFFYLTLKSNSKNFLNFSLAGLFLGMSILSKGPTGIYVIAAPFFLGYWFAYGFPKIKWKGWIGMVILALWVGFSWYIVIYFTDQKNFLATLNEEMNARTNREVKPFTRYFSFPIQMGVWAIFALISLAFPYIKRKTEFPKSYTFFFWWIILCFLFLSIIPSKKERYLFPQMIPLAATTGFYVYYILKNQDWKKWEKIVTKFSFGLVGMVGILIPILLFLILKVDFGFYSLTLSIVSFCIGILILYQILLKFNLNITFLATLGFVASATLFGTPVIDSMVNNNQNYNSVVKVKEGIKTSDLKLYGYNAYSPEIWFKYGEVIPEIKNTFEKNQLSENEFYFIAISTENHKTIENDLQNWGYSIKFIEQFDDNETASGKNNTDRKKMSLFKATKK